MKGYFDRFKNAVVALSGGADSSYLLYLASNYLGKKNVVAVTAINEHVFRYEIENAKKVAKLLDVKWIGFNADMDENFFKNDSLRCYYCKKSFLKKIDEIRISLGYSHIFDGSNLDDLSEERPGRKALKEFSVVSPFIDLLMDKNAISAGLKNSPLKNISFIRESCKATRLVNIPIDYSIINKIETLEDALRDKIKGLRVRFDGEKFFYEIKPPHTITDEQKILLEETISNFNLKINR